MEIIVKNTTLSLSSSIVSIVRLWRWLRLPVLCGISSGLVACEALMSAGVKPVLRSQHLAVIINTQDPQSVAVGEYYQQQRNIPENNLIRVSFPPGKIVMPKETFQVLQARVEQQTLGHIQGYAVTWTYPYRVDCMSITSALALGFNSIYCAQGCKPTAAHEYFNQSSSRPYREYSVRPTMMLAGQSITEAKALIDRGVKADNTNPPGTGYLVSTKDRARNVRSTTYGQTRAVLEETAKNFQIEVVETNALKDRQDVMFYFTGIAQVTKLDTLQFRPGAVGDHLTSYGGGLQNQGAKAQTSILRWLEAGATGSYGTVVEPCNFPQKFPHVGILMQAYLGGATLLESYWQSVAWPGQGLFVGDPLARPFGKN